MGRTRSPRSRRASSASPAARVGETAEEAEGTAWGVDSGGALSVTAGCVFVSRGSGSVTMGNGAVIAMKASISLAATEYSAWLRITPEERKYKR
jgi:hypothetical protein